MTLMAKYYCWSGIEARWAHIQVFFSVPKQVDMWPEQREQGRQLVFERKCTAVIKKLISYHFLWLTLLQDRRVLFYCDCNAAQR